MKNKSNTYKVNLILRVIFICFFACQLNNVWSNNAESVLPQWLRSNESLHNPHWAKLPDNCTSNFAIANKTNYEIVSKFNDYNQFPRDEWAISSPDKVIDTFGYLKGDTLLDSQPGVRSHMVYVPQSCDSSKRASVLVLVHGTFVPNASEYFSLSSALYKDVMNFAQVHAEKNQAPIELISFRWSGWNSSASRRNGALVLANILGNFYPTHEIITIAHSHGCNLVNHLSRILPEHMPIEHMIQLATPVREVTDEQFKPVNFKRLTQFYSTSDLIAAVGSMVINLRNPFMPLQAGSIRKFQLQRDRRIVNIRTQINGQEPGHSDIKQVVHYLPEILERINSIYHCNSDFDLDVNFNDPDPVILAIRNTKLVTVPSNGLLDKELDYSEYQESLFALRYGGRDIHQKRNILRFIF